MPPKAKATEPIVEAPIEPSTEGMTLEQLQVRVAELEAEKATKDKKIEQLEGNEEGWLIWVDNPQYDGQIYGIHFSNGQAWLPKNRVIPQFVRKMPGEDELQKEANDRFAFDHKTTKEDVRARYAEVARISSVEFAVRFLTNDHGYHAKFFSKADLDEVNSLRNERAKQRAEADARLGTMKQQAERLEMDYTRARGA